MSSFLYITGVSVNAAGQYVSHYIAASGDGAAAHGQTWMTDFAENMNALITDVERLDANTIKASGIGTFGGVQCRIEETFHKGAQPNSNSVDLKFTRVSDGAVLVSRTDTFAHGGMWFAL